MARKTQSNGATNGAGSIRTMFAAGLFIRSFDHLTSVDRGFEADGVMVLEVGMGGYRYVTGVQPRVVYDELVQRLEAIPGVVSVAKTETSPFRWTMTRDLTIETREEHKYTSTHFDRVSSSYFETMRIPLLAGRAFSPDETYTSDPVVMVNDGEARLIRRRETLEDLIRYDII